ncbi:MAG: hypothetical protein JW759_02050 [Candidatus Coatesbacteria bacterium]|nr:hypothetical protein [Candidatus Coatesbacteria bacterium]
MPTQSGKVINIEDYRKEISKRSRDKFWSAVSEIAAYARTHACSICPPECYDNPDFRAVVCPFAKLLPFCPRRTTN